MYDTGRIKKTLDPIMQDLVFQIPSELLLEAELSYISQVDEAHVLMLTQCGLLTSEDGSAILKVIVNLTSSNFKSLKEKTPVRGLYLMYEQYLIEKVGAKIGGMLQAGRSRNDLSATITKLRSRANLVAIMREGFSLIAEIHARSIELNDVVLPAYTHYQPAMPITLGHYLRAIGTALLRDLESLFSVQPSLDISPLGAGAGGGTTLKIEPLFTAKLLGFLSTSSNSIDAVASRDFILRMLSSSAILGLTLSRCAQDLLLWSTHEFGFIRFPDELVGSSSMMPQKRNPFLLEHIKGRSASPAATFQRSLLAMHAVPYGNSVAVGTEGLRGFDEAIEDIKSSMYILTQHIHLMEPDAKRMKVVAHDSNTCATSLAEKLATSSEMSFRTAHHKIGSMITEAEKFGINGVLHAAKALSIDLDNDQDIVDWFTQFYPEQVVRDTKYGAGPGAYLQNSLEYPLTLMVTLEQLQINFENCLHRWRNADELRIKSVETLINRQSLT